MLSSERASEGQAAVKKGWAASDHFPETFLNKMSAYAQTLDILNSMFEEEDELMTFQEIRKRFSKMNFDKEAKAACEKIMPKGVGKMFDEFIEAFDKFKGQLQNLIKESKVFSNYIRNYTNDLKTYITENHDISK